MVEENQMTFIKGRQITNVILIANKAIDFWKTKKTKGFIEALEKYATDEKFSN